MKSTKDNAIVDMKKCVASYLFPLEGEGGRRPDEGESKIKTSFMNLTRNPLTCPRITTLRGRLYGHPLPQVRGGTTHGFTLIELLVVVLIIGILAAVAVPQYQKAVYKSQTTEALGILKALKQAQEVYYLANEEYTGDISKLDVEVPAQQIAPKFNRTDEEHAQRYMYSCHISGVCVANAANTNMPLLQYDFNLNTANNPSRLMCIKYKKSDMAEEICKTMGTLIDETADTDYPSYCLNC